MDISQAFSPVSPILTSRPLGSGRTGAGVAFLAVHNLSQSTHLVRSAADLLPENWTSFQGAPHLS